VGGDRWEFSALFLGGSHCFHINPSVFFILPGVLHLFTILRCFTYFSIN
jgi:hypothetical protein